MAPSLTSITNRTATGFRVNYEQNTLPEGYVDKVYYAEFSFTDEGDATYAGSVSVPMDPAYFDISDILSGRWYAVKIFRYNGASLVSVSNELPAMTYASEAVTSSFPMVLDFEEGWGRHYYDLGWPAEKPRLYDAAMGGHYYHDTYHTYPHAIITRNAFPSRGYAFTFEQKVRINKSSSEDCDGWFGLSVYWGEQQYTGLYPIVTNVLDEDPESDTFGQYLAQSNTGGIHWAWDDANPSNQIAVIYEKTNEPFSFDTVHTVRCEYDGTGAAPRIKFYLNDVLVLDAIQNDPPGPFVLWNMMNWQTATPCPIDFGPISVSCAELAGKTYSGMIDHNDNYMFYDRLISELASIWGSEEITTGGRNYRAYYDSGSNDMCGGLTAPFNTGHVSDMAGLYTASPPVTFKTGIHTQDTPVVSAKSFDTLFLNAKQNNGYVKIRVRNWNGDLISDNELPGNSAGFAPNGHQTLDLGGITADGIYLSVSVLYDDTAITDFPPTPSILKAWSISGNDISLSPSYTTRLPRMSYSKIVGPYAPSHPYSTEDLLAEATAAVTIYDVKLLMESLLATVNAVSSVADVQVWIQSLQADISSTVSVTDAQTSVEDAQATGTVDATVEDQQTVVEDVQATGEVTTALDVIQQYLEDIQVVASADVTIDDLKAYIEDLMVIVDAAATLEDSVHTGEILEVYAQAEASVEDYMQFTHDLVAVAVATASVDDLAQLIESLTTVGQGTATITDLAAFAENLLVTVGGEASVQDIPSTDLQLETDILATASTTDKQQFIDDLIVQAGSAATVQDLQHWVDSVLAEALATASVVDWSDSAANGITYAFAIRSKEYMTTDFAIKEYIESEMAIKKYMVPVITASGG